MICTAVYFFSFDNKDAILNCERSLPKKVK